MEVTVFGRKIDHTEIRVLFAFMGSGAGFAQMSIRTNIAAEMAIFAITIFASGITTIRCWSFESAFKVSIVREWVPLLDW